MAPKHSKQFTRLPVSMVTASLVEDVHKTVSLLGSERWQQEPKASFKQAGKKTPYVGDNREQLLPHYLSLTRSL